MSRQDLILLAFGGIQRYIVESHSTADLGNASRIIAELAKKAAEALRAEDDCVLVIPSPSTLAGAAAPDASSAEPPNTPSRIVALAPEGMGSEYARRAAEKVREEWQGWISALFRNADTSPETPGFPDIMWCVAPAGAGDYPTRWKLAQTTLAARKRVRTFDFPERTPADPDNTGDQRGRFGPRPCAVSPRWHSEPVRPNGARKHEKHEELSAAVWLKRLWHADEKLPPKGQQRRKEPLGFPSTAAVATAPYRAKVLDAWEEEEVRKQVGRLHEVARKVMLSSEQDVIEAPVPALKDREEDGDSAKVKRWFVRNGGWWVMPETWNAETLTQKHRTRSSGAEQSADRQPVTEATAADGHAAAVALAEAVGAKPNPYFAILVADLDGLGKHLSAQADQGEHGRISERLAQISGRHRSGIRKRRGAAVYSGGDDLMAFLPAAEALNAADDCRRAALQDPTDLSSDPDPTSISAAVVFVHQGTPLHLSVERAGELLAEAKSVNEKKALAVGYVTGSGARAHTVRPWSTSRVGDALEALNTFMPTEDGQSALSPRLIGDLRKSHTELAELHRQPDAMPMYRGEVTRLVLRHNGNKEQARALLELGASEWAEPARGESGGRHADDRIPLAAARVAVFLRRHV